jgi:hypothetical protein
MQRLLDLLRKDNSMQDAYGIADMGPLPAIPLGAIRNMRPFRQTSGSRSETSASCCGNN